MLASISATPSKYAERGIHYGFLTYSSRLTDKHLDNLLPGGKPLDQDIRRLELMRSGVLLDLERWVSAYE